MQYRLFALTFSSLCFLGNCAQDSNSAYPLLDSNCQEYSKLGAETIALSDQTSLSIFQDAHYIWVCVGLPPESFGMMELRLKTPAQEKEQLLHISAQLGQWPFGDDEAAPQNASSEKWWEYEGWASNAVSFNGMTKRDEEGNRTVKFKMATGREMQISKDHFGRGEWQMLFDIRGLNDEALEGGQVLYPPQSEGETHYFSLSAY